MQLQDQLEELQRKSEAVRPSLDKSSVYELRKGNELLKEQMTGFLNKSPQNSSEILKNSEKNLSQCHFVHHISRMD
jgi:hypothetical protein